MDLSKSKEQDELKDWAELGPLKVRLCLTLRSPEERGVRQASSEIAVAKGSTWQLRGEPSEVLSCVIEGACTVRTLFFRRPTVSDRRSLLALVGHRRLGSGTGHLHRNAQAHVGSDQPPGGGGGCCCSQRRTKHICTHSTLSSKDSYETSSCAKQHDSVFVCFDTISFPLAKALFSNG